MLAVEVNPFLPEAVGARGRGRSELLPTAGAACTAGLGDLGSDGLPIFEDEDEQSGDGVDDASEDAVPTCRDQGPAGVARDGGVDV
jgi:hypothetical protein